METATHVMDIFSESGIHIGMSAELFANKALSQQSF